MTVRVHTLPQTCSGRYGTHALLHSVGPLSTPCNCPSLPPSCSNRVGVGALLKDIYGKPVYTCANSGCGECSSLRYSNLEDGPVSFLQGCDDDESCHGQIAVSVTWDDRCVHAVPSTPLLPPTHTTPRPRAC